MITFGFENVDIFRKMFIVETKFTNVPKLPILRTFYVKHCTSIVKIYKIKMLPHSSCLMIDV